jgi:FKBP-type peptidyl-prolyl cis-trans isomerase
VPGRRSPGDGLGRDRGRARGRRCYGLKHEDLKVGDGPEAVSGKIVEVHYTGWFENGTKFDSSLDRGEPFSFRLGAGEVIQGWDQGVAGMKVGGRRKLIISPSSATDRREPAG